MVRRRFYRGRLSVFRLQPLPIITIEAEHQPNIVLFYNLSLMVIANPVFFMLNHLVEIHFLMFFEQNRPVDLFSQLVEMRDPIIEIGNPVVEMLNPLVEMRNPTFLRAILSLRCPILSLRCVILSLRCVILLF